MTTGPHHPLDRDLGAGAPWPRLIEAWDELLWPKVLTAAKLGLRPGRLGLALLAVLAAAILLGLGLAIDAQIGRPAPAWSVTLVDGLLPWRTYILLPLAAASGYPVTTLVMLPLFLVAWFILAGAISRIVACEFSLGRPLSASDALRFAAPRWFSFLGAVLGPLVAVWLIALLLAGAGALLLRWPGLNLLGALLYPLSLVGGIAAILLLVGYALGHNLAVPAVACEGTDAIDAIQRIFGFIAARPFRVILYLLLAITGLFIVVGIIAVLVYWAVCFAAAASGAWAGEPGRAMVWNGTLTALGLGHAAPEPAGTYRAGALLIRLWTLIPLLLVSAALVSSSIAAMTVAYLCLRRVCNGQDIAELWIPGMIEANMAQAMDSRAQAAAAITPPPAPTNLDDADYE